MTGCVEFDHSACIGCYACVVACSLEHRPAWKASGSIPDEFDGAARIRVEIVGPKVREGVVQYGFRPVACRHCEDAPCLDSCPESAIWRDTKSGILSVLEDKCTGCEVCLQACPYGAPLFHERKAVLCDFCLKGLSDGRNGGSGKTACEAVCPAGAVHVRWP